MVGLNLCAILIIVFCLVESVRAGPVAKKCSRKCRNNCPFGRKLDKKGCYTCKCLPRNCPPVCTNICQYERFNLLKVCSTCRCEPIYDVSDKGDIYLHLDVSDTNDILLHLDVEVPCPKKCDLFCPEGHAKNNAGCPICRCKSETRQCPPLVCKRRCPAGHVMNDRGCKTCKCKLKPTKCRTRICKNACPNGRIKDKFNCPTCKCKKPTKHRVIPPKCLLKKKVGPCRALTPRFFYNKRSKKCQKFRWGGCKPNGNNFKTMRQCRQTCEK